MTVEVKSGGTWRTITAPEVRSGGVWRAIQTIEVKLSGVWREVFSSAVVLSVTPALVVTHNDAVIAIAGGVFLADGGINKLEGVTETRIRSGQWASNENATDGSLYEIRAESMISGTWGGVGAPLGTWIDLDPDDRPWNVFTTSGTNQAVGKMEIREKADTGNIIFFNLDCTASVP